MKNNKKIILDVPIIHQPDGSLECSIAALKMVMDYNNDVVPYQTLVSELSEWINEEERHIQGAGIYLARRGYEVWFTHHDPGVIDKTIENSTEIDKPKLVSKLSIIPQNDSTAYRRKKLSLDIAYIEAGGHYANTIPALDVIDLNLHKKLPTIICVKIKVWSSNPEKRNNHSVVVVGKENDDYIINDPSPKVSSPYKINKNKLLMAWYACGAYTLVVRLQKKTSLHQ